MLLANDNNTLNNGYGFIDVYNQGVFYLFFQIQYTIGRCVYFANTDEYGLLQRKRLLIPSNAINIYLDIQIAVWFTVWKSIFKTRFDTCPYNCFRVYGYAFYPKVEQIVCDFYNSKSYF